MSPKKVPKKPHQPRGERSKTAGTAAAKWKEKDPNMRPPKAAPVPWRAFENSLENRSNMEGTSLQKRLPKKIPKSRTSAVESV